MSTNDYSLTDACVCMISIILHRIHKGKHYIHEINYRIMVSGSVCIPCVSFDPIYLEWVRVAQPL